jgi:hypothetical protein
MREKAAKVRETCEKAENGLAARVWGREQRRCWADAGKRYNVGAREAKPPGRRRGSLQGESTLISKALLAGLA